MLSEELDQFRCQITQMVDIERGFFKEMLERESISIWRKVVDALAGNKRKMLNMLKLEIQKKLHSAREKVLQITDTRKHDMNALTAKLNQTQVRILIKLFGNLNIVGCFHINRCRKPWYSYLDAEKCQMYLYMILGRK